MHFSHYYLLSSITGLVIFRDISFRSLLLCAIRQSYVTHEKIDKNTFSSSSFISHQSRFSLILLHMYSFSPADIRQLTNMDKMSGSLSDEFLFVLESAAMIDHVNLEGVGYQ